VGEVERSWPHEVLPATYFIDAGGSIRSVHEGALDPAALARRAAEVIPAPGG
jgi:hypothetical protein